LRILILWNIAADFTVGDAVEFTNPAGEVVSYNGFNYNLSGTAEPGYSVKIYRNTVGTVDKGNLVATITADSKGNWTASTFSLLSN